MSTGIGCNIPDPAKKSLPIEEIANLVSLLVKAELWVSLLVKAELWVSLEKINWGKNNHVFRVFENTFSNQSVDGGHPYCLHPG